MIPIFGLVIMSVFAELKSSNVIQCQGAKLDFQMDSLGKSTLVLHQVGNKPVKCPYDFSHEKQLTILGESSRALVFARSTSCSAEIQPSEPARGLEIELQSFESKTKGRAFVFREAAPIEFESCRLQTQSLRHLLVKKKMRDPHVKR